MSRLKMKYLWSFVYFFIIRSKTYITRSSNTTIEVSQLFNLQIHEITAPLTDNMHI